VLLVGLPQTGVDNSERREPLPLGYPEEDWGEAGFYREDSCGRCREAVCSPSLDFVPEGDEAGYGARTWYEEVCAI